MNDTKDLGCLPHLPRLQQKNLDILAELALSDPIVHSLLAILEMGSVDTETALTWCIKDLVSLRKDITDQLIRAVKLQPPPPIFLKGIQIEDPDSKKP